MDLLGIDPSDGDVIVDSILDWKEPGDLHRLNGAKSDYYESLSPPYSAKNAPLDRVEELLLIRGVTKGDLRRARPRPKTSRQGPGSRICSRPPPAPRSSQRQHRVVHRVADDFGTGRHARRGAADSS